MENMRIPTIVLGLDLGIRNYTEALVGIFDRKAGDRGHLSADLAHLLGEPDLREALQRVLATGSAVDHPIHRADGSVHYLIGIQPCIGPLGECEGVVLTFLDVTAVAKTEHRHRVMIGELNHRVRNMLSVVNAIATQTLAKSVAPPVLDDFLGRLHAMARTYKLLTEAAWTQMALRDLLKDELSAVAGADRSTLEGPEVQLSPREAIALGMIVHELATNALKYGSLSNADGKVAISWSVNDSEGSAVLHWQERGGPAVQPPSHRGFGSFVIERQLAYELDGQSSVDFAPDGLQVTLTLPLQGLHSGTPAP
jgi:two-component system, chemotaxis family, CheB/CheR fusion protein